MREVEGFDPSPVQNMRPDRNSKGILICFVGIDGAGKSTLAKALTAIMQRQGIRSRYLWAGFKSSFMIFRPFVAIMKATMFHGDRHMQESRTKGRVVKSPLLSTIYQYLALLDYILQSLVRIRLPLALGRNVICDRYIYGLVTSIAVLLEYPVERTLALLSRCLRFLPTPNLVFLIDLPEAMAYQRKDDTWSVDSLSVQRAIYLQMAGQCDMTVLDGTNDPGELTESVANRVLQYIGGEG